jgi:NAD(P)-dependent dehydrogenase (short-subunit alcohol dehydrogenase family)
MCSIYGLVAPKFDIYEETNMTMPVEYAAIKAAILNLTRYYASYYKGSSIRFNCISPGGVINDQPTNFIENYNKKCLSKGMLDPKDVSKTLLFLLSDNSSYIHGANIVIDDGFSI